MKSIVDIKKLIDSKQNQIDLIHKSERSCSRTREEIFNCNQFIKICTTDINLRAQGYYINDYELFTKLAKKARMEQKNIWDFTITDIKAISKI